MQTILESVTTPVESNTILKTYFIDDIVTFLKGEKKEGEAAMSVKNKAGMYLAE